MVTSVVAIDHDLEVLVSSLVAEIEVLALVGLLKQMTPEWHHSVHYLPVQHHAARAYRVHLEDLLFGPLPLRPGHELALWSLVPDVPYQPVRRQVLVDAVETMVRLNILQQRQIPWRYRIRVQHPQVGAVAFEKLSAYLVPILHHAPTGAVDVNICIRHGSGGPYQPAGHLPINPMGGRDSQEYLQISIRYPINSDSCQSLHRAERSPGRHCVRHQ